MSHRSVRTLCHWQYQPLLKPYLTRSTPLKPYSTHLQNPVHSALLTPYAALENMALPFTLRQQSHQPKVAQPGLQVVRGGEVPPPSTVGCSCVYILRRGDGRFYCGQTDELKGRLNRHRKTGKVRGGGRLEAVYLVVPCKGQGQSTARAVEAQMIQVSP